MLKHIFKRPDFRTKGKLSFQRITLILKPLIQFINKIRNRLFPMTNKPADIWLFMD